VAGARENADGERIIRRRSGEESEMVNKIRSGDGGTSSSIFVGHNCEWILQLMMTLLKDLCGVGKKKINI
jgi:hypothetical protein